MIPNAVVHVPTREDLGDFVGFCEKHALRWCTGNVFRGGDRWGDYSADTCYFIEKNQLTYANIEFAKGEYLTNDRFEADRPTDSRLFLCSVYDLIQIVESGNVSEDELDISFLDSLL